MKYTIGQISEKFNLSIHTLRYYDKEGLLPFVKRTQSGIREFDEEAIGGLQTIECLKKTSMPLKDIKCFLDWCKEGNATLEKRRAMFYERKKLVLEQIAEMQKVLDMIDFKCWYYDTAIEKGSEEYVFGLPVEEMPNNIQSLYKNSH